MHDRPQGAAASDTGTVPSPTHSIEGYLAESGSPVCIRWQEATVTSIEPVDTAPPMWVSAGLIDVQVNGYGGHDFSAAEDGPAEVVAAVRALWNHGVTRLCPTICTDSEDAMLRSLEQVAAARRLDALVAHSIMAIHVEGPHISSEDGPRGVHPLAHIRPPDLAEYRRWQAAAAGLIGIVTLAPELPGALDYIEALYSEGTVVSLGHTNATGGQIRAAVEAGASLSTHLGNGAHASIRRHPNYIWEQLAEDRLAATFILDGRHLPGAVARSMLRAKGTARSIAVSDAVALAGMPPGRYRGFGTDLELTPDGRLVLAGTSYLAGSTGTVEQSITMAMRHAGLSLADAVRLSTSNPAALLPPNLVGGNGHVRVGGTADLVAFRLDPDTGDVQVEQTVVAGTTVFRRSTATAGAAGAER